MLKSGKFKKTANGGSVMRNARKGVVLGGALLALTTMGSPAARAETCQFPAFGVGGLNTIGAFGSSVAANISAAIQSASTAFLLQSSAFVSGPGGAQPDQQGSGVWTRAVGGSVEIQNNSTNVLTAASIPPGITAAGTFNCQTRIHQDFAGFQVGHDIARLNLGGWNVHWGTTAGYLEANGRTVGNNAFGGAFNSNVQTPFAGTYVAVNRGGFFADALVRAESYQATLNSPTINLNNQQLNARGYSIAASAGYHHVLPNSRWFVEPSAGIVYSRTKVDALNTFDPGPGIQGTFQLNTIESAIGRLGVRVGTTVESGNMVWQPFAAASVWHEFADPSSGAFQSCVNCAFVNPPGSPFPINVSYRGTAIGTYGQYSLGASGQVLNTGWVGFVRVDYRNGENIESISGTGGIRYHFTPDLARTALVGKSPVKAAPMVVAPNWTGFYLGGHAGAAFAQTDMDFVGGFEANPRGAGALGGGQFGYNRQISNVVWGIEADASWTNLNGSRECRTLGAAPAGGAGINAPLRNTTCHVDSDVFATLTARLGITSGRALWYVKGGAAYASNLYSVSCNINNTLVPVGQQCVNPAGALINLNAPISGNGDSFGWTLGYGIEFALTNKWSAKAETSYMDFGTRNVTLTDGTVTSTHHAVLATKIGVNYKLTNN